MLFCGNCDDGLSVYRDAVSAAHSNTALGILDLIVVAQALLIAAVITEEERFAGHAFAHGILCDLGQLSRENVVSAADDLVQIAQVRDHRLCIQTKVENGCRAAEDAQRSTQPADARRVDQNDGGDAGDQRKQQYDDQVAGLKILRQQILMF